MNKNERMAHARAHRGGQTPDHKLTGPEALAKQIEDSKALREKEARERSAAASEREARSKKAQENLSRESQLKEGFIKAKLKRGHNAEWKTYTVREWEGMTVPERAKFIFQRTADPNNYYQLSGRLANSSGRGRGTVVHSSIFPPRRA
jgi:hypothetical protein